MKTCTKCKILKDFSQFGKSKLVKDGHKSACKSCLRQDNRKYYQDNLEKESIRKKKQYDRDKDKIIAQQLEYYHGNKDKRRSYLKKKRHEQPNIFQEYKIQFQKTHPDYDKTYRSNRRKVDPLFKLVGNLRTRTYCILKEGRWSKNKKLNDYIGCNLYELMDHLQNKFLENMNWDNYGEWHIDHIIPLSSAKTEEEIYKLFHYTNLQPLWALDNLRKSDKL